MKQENRDIKITALILSGFAAYKAYSIMALRAGAQLAAFHFLLGQIFVLTSVLTISLLQINKPSKLSWFHFTPWDVYTLVKMNLLSIASLAFGTAGFYLAIPAILLYDQSHLATKHSLLGRYFKKAEDRKWRSTRLFLRCALLPMALLFMAHAPMLTFTTILVAGSLSLGFDNFLDLALVPKSISKALVILAPILALVTSTYFPFAGLLLLGTLRRAYVLQVFAWLAQSMGYSHRTLFSLPTNAKPQKDDLFSNPYRNFRTAFIVFALMTYPLWGTLLSSLGLWGCLLEVYAILIQPEPLSLLISGTLFFLLQPLDEEILCRSLLYRYCMGEGLCPDDYKAISTSQKVLYGIFGGTLFALMHAVNLQAFALAEFSAHFASGFCYTMLTFLSGHIDIPTYFHTFNNLLATCYLGITSKVIVSSPMTYIDGLGSLIHGGLRHGLVNVVESKSIPSPKKVAMPQKSSRFFPDFSHLLNPTRIFAY